MKKLAMCLEVLNGFNICWDLRETRKLKNNLENFFWIGLEAAGQEDRAGQEAAGVQGETVKQRGESGAENATRSYI